MLRTAHASGSPNTLTEGQRWAPVASGLLVLTLMAVAFVLANVLPAEEFALDAGYPSPFAPRDQIERFFAENATTVRALSVVLAVLGVALLAFVITVTELLRRPSGQGALFVRTALASGTLASGFMMLSAILTWTLSRSTVIESTPVLRAVQDLTFLAGGPAHVIFVGVFLATASTAALVDRVLSRWVTWLGLVAAAVCGVAVIAMLWQPATYILPLTRLLLAAWIIATCFEAIRGRRPGRTFEEPASMRRGDPRRIAS